MASLFFSLIVNIFVISIITQIIDIIYGVCFINHKPFSIYEKYVKRFFDCFISLSFLVFFLPLLVVLYIFVYVKLGSPAIFIQERPGLNERIFKLYKFRTMTNEKDSNGELLPDEYRFTHFGRILRKLSLDELPELINIIKGEMSIVGPRPLLVRYLDRYNEEQHHRHDVRPGLTGLAQVNGRNSISWEEKFKYDVQYVNNITFRNDLMIILKTILKAFVKQEGIYSNEDVNKNEFMGN